MKRHNCKALMCETPHDFEPRNYQYEEKQYVAWAEKNERELCPHGFKRVTGIFDCQQCVEKERAHVA